MKSKQIMFFATRSDIQEILANMEDLFHVVYFETGLFDSNNPTKYTSIFSITNFGQASAGDWNNDRGFMIVPKEHKLVVRDINQRAGGTKYAIDPFANPDSASLRLGGLYENNIMVAGNFGIVYNADFANSIFKYFSSKIKTHFKRIGAFYVGEEAQIKLREGWRLVTDEKSPREYDLTYDDLA